MLGNLYLFVKPSTNPLTTFVDGKFIIYHYFLTMINNKTTALKIFGKTKNSIMAINSQSWNQNNCRDDSNIVYQLVLFNWILGDYWSSESKKKDLRGKKKALIIL